MNYFESARDLVKEFKGSGYLFGNNVLKNIGNLVKSVGNNAVLIRPQFPGSEKYIAQIHAYLDQVGVNLVADIKGARPNAPREDLFRIRDELQKNKYDVLISFGGGSTIDTAKAAEVLCTLGGEIDDYFGTGLVTKKIKETGKKLTPHVAIQTAASSGAHLTKYSNITDTKTSQKKLIVDEAIVPAHPVFDYTITHQAPLVLTADGAMDGASHILEVFYGSVNKAFYEKLVEIAKTGIYLIVNYLPKIENNPEDMEAREALCLATDLGAYAIMVGGTNGGHLTSFSLVDILSHGRACALMNPYYTVFFAPAIEGPLKIVATVLKDSGYISEDLTNLTGRQLGVEVANGMFVFAKATNSPTTLDEIEGFTQGHIERALTAAKNPQLKMKLENMPVPLNAEMIDQYMGPILEAAKTGDLSLIKNI